MDFKNPLMAGDTHGDIFHVRFLFALAEVRRSDVIVQLGDFGYWEHDTERGERYLNGVADMSQKTGIPFFWIDGNHENHELLRLNYGPDESGFWPIRDGLFYIPRGHRWTWSGKTFLGLGGAYSIDIDTRTEGVSWWREEEITYAEATKAMEGGKVDIMLTHDKPFESKPTWNRKAYERCYPNQKMVSMVMKEVHPAYLFHGHLHFRYDDKVTLDDGWEVNVHGIASNLQGGDGSALPFRIGG